MFSKILQHEKIPEEWIRSITIPIFTKGDKSNPASTVSTFKKIIFSDGISSQILINEEQGETDPQLTHYF